MLPFIELPKVIINSESEEKEVITRLQPNEIAEYYPGFHWGVIVVLKSGTSTLVKMEVEELDATLLAYHNATKANSGKFGNLKINSKPKLHAAS